VPQKTRKKPEIAAVAPERSEKISARIEPPTAASSIPVEIAVGTMFLDHFAALRQRRATSMP
jgi:hypothetical protein